MLRARTLYRAMEAAYAAHYQRFADFAGGSIASAWFLPASSTATNARILVKRSQKDAAGVKSKATLQSVDFNIADGTFSHSFSTPLDSSILAVSPSPSGRYLGILRAEGEANGSTAAVGGAGKKVALELWDTRGTCLRSIPCTGLHGDPLCDGWFTAGGDGLVWSRDERLAVYVAERKGKGEGGKGITEAVRGAAQAAVQGQPSALKPYGQQVEAGTAGAGGGLQAGSLADFEAGGKEDWGEKYVGVSSPGLFIVDWHAGCVVPLESQGMSVAMGQPAWVEGQGERWLVYTAWPTGGGRKLGMIYCYNRPCALYAVRVDAVLAEARRRVGSAFDTSAREEDEKGAAGGAKPQPLPTPVHYCLTPDHAVARSPRPHPSGTRLAYLAMSSTALHTHNGASELWSLDWAGWRAGVGSGGGEEQPAPPPAASTTCVLPRVEWPPVPTLMRAPNPPSVHPPSAWPGWWPGLYAHSLGQGAWGEGRDAAALYVNTHVGSVGCVARVDMAQGQGQGQPWDPFQDTAGQGPGAAASTALCAMQEVPGGTTTAAAATLLALCVSSSPREPDRLVVYSGTRVAGPGAGKVAWVKVDMEPEALVAGVEGEGAGGDAAPVSLSIPGPGGSPLPSPSLALPSSLSTVRACLQGLTYSVLPVYPRVGGGEGGEGMDTPFEVIVLRPREKEEEGGRASTLPARPLLLVPHGGPHSAFTTTFLPSYAYMASLGYIVALVNYRGSTGYGEGALASLPGHAGTLDVDDCYTATLMVAALGGDKGAQQAVAAHPANAAQYEVLQGWKECAWRVDPGRIVLAGGSHGGFLAFHLMAYPSRLLAAAQGTAPVRYAAAVIRNPVTNILTMAGSTDIPDWCWSEACGVGAWPALNGPPYHGPGTGGGAQAQPVITAETAARMLAVSPMAHFDSIAAELPTCPVLLMLGCKDRRVPPSQGMEMYHALRARWRPRGEGEGEEAWRSLRLLTFPEDVHALDKPGTEGEAWPAIAAWLHEVLKL